MNLTSFKSNYECIGEMPTHNLDIKNEPMFFNCSVDFIMNYDCPITKEFIKRLPVNNYIIDSRVHMLKPGWYPAIPGWHLDFAYRDPKTKLLDLTVNKYSDHYFTVIGNTSMTMFLKKDEVFNTVCYPTKGYKDYSSEIDALIENKQFETELVKSGQIIRFSNTDFHRATMATESCWRIFIRASIIDKKPVNEIRKQVQVYLEDLNLGW